MQTDVCKMYYSMTSHSTYIRILAAAITVYAKRYTQARFTHVNVRVYVAKISRKVACTGLQSRTHCTHCINYNVLYV